MITLDRRRFLQGIAATSLAIAVPVIPAGKPRFDLPHDFGMAVNYQVAGLSREERDHLENIIACNLAKEARDFLPRGTRFEIRAMYPMDYGRAAGMAWYYLPYMSVAPQWEPLDEPDRNPLLGHILLNRGVA